LRRVKENLDARGSFSIFSIASHGEKEWLERCLLSVKLLYGNGMDGVRVFWRNLGEKRERVEGRGSRLQNEK
jgi:hypothetical protein